MEIYSYKDLYTPYLELNLIWIDFILAYEKYIKFQDLGLEKNAPEQSYMPKNKEKSRLCR